MLLTVCSSEFVENFDRLFTPSSHLGPFTGDGGGGAAEWGGPMAARQGGAETVRGRIGNFIFYERDKRNEVGCRVQWDGRLRLSIFVYSMLQSR